MKTWIAFVAGGLFALALVMSCASHNAGPGGTANAAGGVVWEYATLSGFDQTVTMPSGVYQPAGAASCSSTTCTLNAFGAERWELVIYDPGNVIVLKRPK